jgi:hypothetical protein
MDTWTNIKEDGNDSILFFKIISKNSQKWYDTLYRCGDFANSMANNRMVETLTPLLTPIRNSILEPMVSTRPNELLSDVVSFSLPFTSHTNACINYVKRAVRASVFRSDKENGIVSFAINPKDSWLLNMSKVNVDAVLANINEWLLDMQSDSYPNNIIWINYPPLRSKVNHGDYFLINY